jgi:hypothetical protein
MLEKCIYELEKALEKHEKALEEWRTHCHFMNGVILQLQN